MKLRTINEIQEALDRELVWRLRELTDVKFMIETTKTVRQNSIIRAAVPLLYAHFEGFIKLSSEYYINYVGNQRKMLKNLSPNMRAHVLRPYFQKLATSKHHKDKIDLLSAIENTQSIRSRFHSSGIINTQSNLNSAVFEEIACMVGININWYESKYIFMDEKLLAKRNKIAHGEFLDVDFAGYVDLHEQLIEVLRAYKTDLENAISLKTYSTM